MSKQICVISGEEVAVSVSPLSDGWRNILIERKVAAGSKRIMTRGGGWTTVRGDRTRYHLAHNGDRFAQGTELRAFVRKFGKGALLDIERILGL